MVSNRNSALSEEVRDVFKLQQNVDGTISNIAGQIIPVVDVNPKHSRKITITKSVSSNATGSTTVYTTPTNQDFYLMGFSAGFIKDAACDNTSVILTSVVKGETVYLFRRDSITATADQAYNTVMFSYPMKIDRGTNIVLAGNKTAGVLAKDAIIWGYVDEASTN